MWKFLDWYKWFVHENLIMLDKFFIRGIFRPVQVRLVHIIAIATKTMSRWHRGAKFYGFSFMDSTIYKQYFYFGNKVFKLAVIYQVSISCPLALLLWLSNTDKDNICIILYVWRKSNIFTKCFVLSHVNECLVFFFLNFINYTKTEEKRLEVA